MSLVDELDQFKKLFKFHLSSVSKATFRWVTADSVDWDNLTMTASDSDNLEYHDVLLGIGMIKVKPKIDTDCLIAIIEDDETSAFLLFANEFELIQYGDGENGGFAVVPELVKQLKILTARVDGLYNAAKSSTVIATPQDGGTALWGLYKTELAKVTEKEDFTEIENKKILH